MASATAIVGVAYLLTGAGLLVLLREPFRRPDKPASTGFALAVLGISLWPLSLGINYFVAGFAPSMALWTLRLSAASVISVGWFLVAAAVTGRLSLSRTVAATSVAYVLIELLLVVSNGAHGLVFGPATTVDGTIPVVAYGPWFWLQTVVNYGLIAVGTGLLVVEWSRSSGLRRRQTAVLSAAVVPPVAANVVTLFGFVPTVHDLTPFGLVGSGLLLSWALYRAEFLDIVPVARQAAMAEMQDAVVTLDDEDRIVDASDELIALSEKARTIEGLVDRTDETATYDLRVVAERVVGRVRDRHPHAAYAVDGPETCTVSTGEGVESAVECLVENAVEHNDASEPTVDVTVGCGANRSTVAVSDDGPGISEHERAVLHRKEETPLAHGSGIGLWIVSWVADCCDGDLSFDVDEEGTTVTLRFPDAN
jgi:signal transduction histidine kinase